MATLSIRKQVLRRLRPEAQDFYRFYALVSPQDEMDILVARALEYYFVTLAKSKSSAKPTPYAMETTGLIREAGKIIIGVWTDFIPQVLGGLIRGLFRK